MQFYEFGKSRGVTYVNNVFIGGVSSVINTATLLAEKLEYYPSGLAFYETDIHNFEIVGSDIKCAIVVDYKTRGLTYAFGNGQSTTNLITSFIDNGNYCKDIGESTFRNCINFTNFIAKGIVNLTGSYIFRGCTSLNMLIEFPNCISISNAPFYSDNNEPFSLYLPYCLTYGTTVLDNSVFYLYKLSNNIYANLTMQTINGGAEEGDLAYARARGVNISYIQNYTVPNAVTDLAVATVYATAIKLDWTAPTSTNTIDYYEIYVNGVLNSISYVLVGYVVGLTNLQTYDFTIVAVDIYYNKSLVSNTVTQQINGTDVIPYTDIISEYKIDRNGLDTAGVNNGVTSNITYDKGLVGYSGKFNGDRKSVV